MGVGTSREGEVLKGKYRLESLLGAGGMGEVYRARNTLVDRDVAIKILHKRHIENTEVVGRFMREAKAANAVRHRNIVDVLDIDTLDDGVPFIVQEYLEGSDLSKRLEKPPHQLPPEEALSLLLPVIEAVGEAHKRGIVHRDLKPENIYLAIVDGETVPKILDFGISKVPLEEEAKRRTLGGSGGIANESTSERLTMMGAGLGTPYYMSPEQIRDPRTVDARTDVWSIGVMFYEALTGRMPFDAEDLAGLFAQIQTQDPVDVRRLVPSCPPELARIIHRCLSPNREGRHDDAATLARALRQHRTKSQAPDAIAVGAAPPSVPPAAAVPDLGMAATQLEVAPEASSRSVPDIGGLELELPTKSKPPKKRKRPPRTSKPAMAAMSEAEDDDPFALGGGGDGLALELAVDMPTSARPRVAATSGSPSSRAPSSRGPSSRPPSSRDARGIRVRRRSDKGPSVVWPLLVMGLAGGIVVGGYFVQPRLTPEAVLATQQELGGAKAALLYLGVTGVAALGTLWIAAAGIRRIAYALLLATLGMIATSLGGLAASGIVAAPGLLPSELSKIGFLAGAWGSVAAAIGLGLFAIGRGRELRDDAEIGWMGNLFLVAGVVALGAAGWMAAMGPKVSVADAGLAGSASAEKAALDQAERFCITVAGGDALSNVHEPIDPAVVAAAGAAGALLPPQE